MISDVLAYYRARMKELGRAEWAQPDHTTIPKNKLMTSFHIEMGTAQALSDNQQVMAVEVPVVIRIPFAPTREAGPLRDLALAYTDKVISNFLTSKNRTTFPGIQNVSLDTMTVDPLADSNDNGLIIRLGLKTLTYISTR